MLEEEVLKQRPDLGVRAAQSLKLLSKKIYLNFKKSGKSPLIVLNECELFLRVVQVLLFCKRIRFGEVG